jgi:diguanylate cyclase
METIQDDWKQLFQNLPAEVRSEVLAVIQHNKAELADAFYSRMLQDPDAKIFLTHEAVHNRLHSSMQRWLETLFSCDTPEQLQATIAMQRHVGEVHARVDLPVNLVARGMRVLKKEIAAYLQESEQINQEQLIKALLYVHRLVDLAFEVMSLAYLASHERSTRIDEAYRAFSSGQNMSLERERQRAALLDWENGYLQASMAGQEGDELPPLGSSSFGLWMQHKATAFEGAPELGTMLSLMQSIDQDLLPLCAEQLGKSEIGESRRLFKEIRIHLGELKFLLNSMFENLVSMESGRDSLTQLFNRRFLPAVLAREIDIAMSQNKTFALLMVDIDYFKSINDQHGHQAGDRVLQQVSSLLQHSVRAGDFVFRYGGEEFLLLLVEVGLQQAMNLAEKIRHRVETETIPILNGQELQTTVSMGVALFDGHPDYQHLVSRADEALYRAKNKGRNRCLSA